MNINVGVVIFFAMIEVFVGFALFIASTAITNERARRIVLNCLIALAGAVIGFGLGAWFVTT